MPPVSAAAGAASSGAAGAAGGAAVKGAASSGAKSASTSSAKPSTNKGSLPSIDKNPRAQSNARNFLGSRENSAENDSDDNNSEENDINYTGSGNSSNNSVFRFDKKNKDKIKANLKKASPVLAIIAVFLVPLFLLFGMGSLLFADIDENTMEAMDIQHPFMVKMAQKVMKKYLSDGSLPSPFAERLADAGLEVGYLDDSGSFIAGLRPNSESKVAMTTTSDSNISESSKVATISPEIDNSLVLRFKNVIITSADWDSYFENDPEVYKAFQESTYGRAAGHYDDAAELFYSNINASRNVFSNYTSDDSADFREVLGNYYNNKADSAYEVKDSACPEVGGTPTLDNECSDSTQGHSDAITNYLNTLYDNTTIEPDDSDFNDCPGNYKTDGYCRYDKAQAATIAYLVNSALNANETYESMKYFLTLAETMSKTKAGDGANAPINEMLNFLVETDENGVSAVQSPTLSSVLTRSYGDYTADDKAPYSIDRLQNIISEHMKIITNDYLQIALGTTSLSWSGSSSSSYGIKDDSLSIIKLVDEQEEPEEPQLEEYIDDCTIYLITDPDSYDGCIVTQTAQYNADYYIYETVEKPKYKEYLLKICNPNSTDPDFLEKLAKYDTSISECKSYHNTAADLLEELTTALEFSNDSKTTFLSDEGFNSLVGSDTGELFSKGASNLGYKIASTAQGGTIGTNESVVAYKKVTDDILALDAAASRIDKNPFDITSKNTFLGSIVHSFSSYLYTTPSISSTLSSFSSLFNHSLLSILPGAFAEDEKSFQTTYGECPESTTYKKDGKDDYVCSVFSHPTVTFDTDSLESTIDNLDSYLATNVNTVDKKPIKNSELEEFIAYNNNRTSNVGYVNKTIAEEIEKNNPNFFSRGIKQFTQFLKNKIFQFVDDTSRIADYFSTYYSRFTDEELQKIAGNAYLDDGSSEWNSGYKNAQAYCGLSRFLDQTEYFAKNNTNTTAFSDYFIPGSGENPYIAVLKETSTDFSTLNDTEYLAAISGMSEKEASVVLGYFAYNSYLASIDYENRLAFGREDDIFNFENSIQFEETDPIKTELALLLKNDNQKPRRKDFTYAA